MPLNPNLSSSSAADVNHNNPSIFLQEQLMPIFSQMEELFPGGQLAIRLVDPSSALVLFEAKDSHLHLNHVEAQSSHLLAQKDIKHKRVRSTSG